MTGTDSPATAIHIRAARRAPHRLRRRSPPQPLQRLLYPARHSAPHRSAAAGPRAQAARRVARLGWTAAPASAALLVAGARVRAARRASLLGYAGALESAALLRVGPRARAARRAALLGRAAAPESAAER